MEPNSIIIRNVEVEDADLLSEQVASYPGVSLERTSVAGKGSRLATIAGLDIMLVGGAAVVTLIGGWLGKERKRQVNKMKFEIAYPDGTRLSLQLENTDKSEGESSQTITEGLKRLFQSGAC
jgi:hypothetical protein